jgi:hypothetical protein
MHTSFSFSQVVGIVPTTAGRADGLIDRLPRHMSDGNYDKLRRRILSRIAHMLEIAAEPARIAHTHPQTEVSNSDQLLPSA